VAARGTPVAAAGDGHGFNGSTRGARSRTVLTLRLMGERAALSTAAAATAAATVTVTVAMAVALSGAGPALADAGEFVIPEGLSSEDTAGPKPPSLSTLIKEGQG
jgi:hypothetical protein